MAKGMSLEEFRSALSSDATIENERLKTELEELRKSSSSKIKDLQSDLEQYKEWHKQLCNRCFVPDVESRAGVFGTSRLIYGVYHPDGYL